MTTEWIALLPYLLLAAGGTLIFCVGALASQGSGRQRVLYPLALAAAVLAGIAVLAGPPGAASFGGLLDQGAFARFFTFLFCAITAAVLLFGHRYNQARGLAGDEYYGVLLFAAAGMALVSGAEHWLVFFLGLEIFSLSLYLLIAAPKGIPAANEAGLKYFIMGAAASAVLTFGIALLYAVTGSLEIKGSLGGAGEADLPGILLALSLILVGVGFKLSLVPFHLWTPDVYQGAPAPVTAFLTTGSKAALFAALIRIGLNLSEQAWSYCLPGLWTLAALTMAAGNFAALYQTQVKRLLAYSSIGQMGYLLMALVAVKQGSLPALIFYLVVYVIMDLGAFGLIGTLSGPREDRDRLEDFYGLGYSRPWLAAVLTACLISLVGLPPTAGFMGKLVLFQVVLRANYLVLGLLGILAVIVSIFAYVKILVALYLHPAEPGGEIPAAGFSASLAGAVIFFLILGLGVLPAPLLNLIARVAALFPSYS
jgi:NADH-quinone oxidoreductase subunit N